MDPRFGQISRGHHKYQPRQNHGDARNNQSYNNDDSHSRNIKHKHEDAAWEETEYYSGDSEEAPSDDNFYRSHKHVKANRHNEKIKQDSNRHVGNSHSKHHLNHGASVKKNSPIHKKKNGYEGRARYQTSDGTDLTPPDYFDRSRQSTSRRRQSTVYGSSVYSGDEPNIKKIVIKTPDDSADEERHKRANLNPRTSLIDGTELEELDDPELVDKHKKIIIFFLISGFFPLVFIGWVIGLIISVAISTRNDLEIMKYRRILAALAAISSIIFLIVGSVLAASDTSEAATENAIVEDRGGVSQAPLLTTTCGRGLKKDGTECKQEYIHAQQSSGAESMGTVFLIGAFQVDWWKLSPILYTINSRNFDAYAIGAPGTGNTSALEDGCEMFGTTEVTGSNFLKTVVQDCLNATLEESVVISHGNIVTRMITYPVLLDVPLVGFAFYESYVGTSWMKKTVSIDNVQYKYHPTTNNYLYYQYPLPAYTVNGQELTRPKTEYGPLGLHVIINKAEETLSRDSYIRFIEYSHSNPNATVEEIDQAMQELSNILVPQDYFVSFNNELTIFLDKLSTKITESGGNKTAVVEASAVDNNVDFCLAKSIVVSAKRQEGTAIITGDAFCGIEPDPPASSTVRL